MRKLLFFIIFLLATNSSLVTSASQNSAKDKDQQLIQRAHQIDGEITTINGDFITVLKSGISFKLKIAPKVKIICNNQPSSWMALRPITSQAFFDGRIVLNELNQVILIDGYYKGEECIIKKWRLNKKLISICISSITNEQEKWRIVLADARLPVEQWLDVGQVIYVLYNRDNQIRAVYLPD